MYTDTQADRGQHGPMQSHPWRTSPKIIDRQTAQKVGWVYVVVVKRWLQTFATTQSCLLRTMLSEAEAKAAAAVNVAKICENFKLKRAKITDLDPGVLRWLDAQVCLPAC